MLDFIKSKPANLDMILSHLQSSAIMDLLLTLVRLEELPEAKGTVQVSFNRYVYHKPTKSSLKWLNDNGLLLNLINRLDPDLETEVKKPQLIVLCSLLKKHLL